MNIKHIGKHIKHFACYYTNILTNAIYDYTTIIYFVPVC
jgi:hypothetical protein